MGQRAGRRNARRAPVDCGHVVLLVYTVVVLLLPSSIIWYQLVWRYSAGGKATVGRAAIYVFETLMAQCLGKRHTGLSK